MHFDYTQYKQKGFAPILILVGILILASVGGAYYFFKVKTPEQKACTMDAKICPDGTSVGRSGPNCEFAPCPKFSSSPTPGGNSDWKTYDGQYVNFRYPSSWNPTRKILGAGATLEDIKLDEVVKSIVFK